MNLDEAAERKRKRLEAWRNRQQQQKAAAPPKKKVTLSLGLAAKKIKKRHRADPVTKPVSKLNAFYEDENEEENEGREKKKQKRSMGFDLDDDDDTGVDDAWEGQTESSRQPASISEPRRKKSSRWDVPKVAKPTAPVSQLEAQPQQSADDALDKFMEKLDAGALGNVTLQDSVSLNIDVGGSIMRKKTEPPQLSGGVITADQLAQLEPVSKKKSDKESLYTASDWESDATSMGGASETETDDEEQARRQLIEALKSNVSAEEPVYAPQLAAEVKTEKQKREERLRELERDAEKARQLAEKNPDFGRLYNDAEGGIMEEAERNLEALTAAPDALEVLAELNKKKELKAVNHSEIDYITIRKNLFTVPRSLASLSAEQISDCRAKLKIKVRGQGAPAPISSFRECGLSERILALLSRQEISKPFPIQAQCLPCIMAGRDVIGIAKTGSGKTLAYLLPLLRHIGDQPALAPNASGPIGLIMAPARELATQIYAVCKVFSKHLGINIVTNRGIKTRSTAVYGGAGVAEQISDLKRGTEIAICTPGRLIDILTMQSGKILSLHRVSYIVLDEADRLFDMGFAPQISAILSAVRPDRQTVLFSATFPKAVEILARKSLKYPIEVMVGGRSVASDSVTQYAEVVEEDEKFLRMLQLLGEYVDDDKKVIIFVDTQVRVDSVFEQLLKCGYPCLSLHGGKEQEDRDSTIADFKREDGPGVLVATSVAGRGLDVPSIGCVINYSSPNHLEDYVHRVGRTGRAGSKGVAYTFVSSTDEAKYAPIVVRAMMEAGQSENISEELKKLSALFKEKVKSGEAKYAGSGFKGKGYSYDSSELSKAQKVARLEKRQTLIEAGLLDPDDEDPLLEDAMEGSFNDKGEAGSGDQSQEKGKPSYAVAADLQSKMSADILALPGMQAAIMRKAGILPEDPTESAVQSTGANHFMEDLDINDYPREARWKVTQKETTSRLQDEFQTAVTLKGVHVPPNQPVPEGERRLYLHLEATSERILKNCVLEIKRLLSEETLRVGARSSSGSHRYNVLG